MPFEFQLPDVGEGLTEGEIVKWLVKEGDAVTENQPLVTVLTDKAEVEIPSPKTGRILRLLAKEGQKVPVHSVIVEIETGAAAAPAAHPGHAAASAAVAAPPKPAVIAPSKPGQVLATPGVRKLAADLRVDLGTLAGTGPNGRVTEEDVRRASGSAPPPHPATTAPGGAEIRIPFKGIRRRTAEKMAESTRRIPHVSHMDECDATELVALRERLKPQAEQKGVKLTFLPFILKALVLSLKDFPSLNSVLDEAGEAIVLKKHYHIGMAVSSPHGLFVPVVRDADRKDVWTLARETAELAAKARDNKLAVDDISGGTFTVTNIGPVGGLFATPIINSPEAGILAVMKLAERPVVRGGQIVARTMMNLVLSFDHRLLDGAEAAQFMNALVKRLESPKDLAA